MPLDSYPALASEDGFIRATFGDERILVIHRKGGGYIAISMTCTHWACDVDWAPEVDELHCSCHGSRFSPDGAVLEGPADEPLPTWVATLEGEVVIVRPGPAS